jgi:hypothetical protein
MKYLAVALVMGATPLLVGSGSPVGPPNRGSGPDLGSALARLSPESMRAALDGAARLYRAHANGGPTAEWALLRQYRAQIEDARVELCRALKC